MDFLANNSHRISLLQALTRELCPEIAGIILAEIIKIWRRWAKGHALPFYEFQVLVSDQIKPTDEYLSESHSLLFWIYVSLRFCCCCCCYTSGVNWTWFYYRECYWIFYKTIPQNTISLWNIYYIRIYYINSP